MPDVTRSLLRYKVSKNFPKMYICLIEPLDIQNKQTRKKLIVNFSQESVIIKPFGIRIIGGEKNKTESGRGSELAGPFQSAISCWESSLRELRSIAQVNSHFFHGVVCIQATGIVVSSKLIRTHTA